VLVTQANQTLAASFTENQCTLTLTPNPSNGGTVGGAGTGICGRTQPITATAGSGWTFTGWSDGIGAASRSIVVSQPLQTLTAAFTLNQVLVDQLAEALVHASGLPAALSSALDALGNRNGILDLGDLVALLDRTPNAQLSEAAIRLLEGQP